MYLFFLLDFSQTEGLLELYAGGTSSCKWGETGCFWGKLGLLWDGGVGAAQGYRL